VESNARTFLHLVIEVVPKPKKLVSKPNFTEGFTMEEALDRLLEIHDDEPFVRGGPQDGTRMAILDYRHFDEGAILLFSFADEKISDPTMQDLDTGDVDTLTPRPNNAWAYSAHLVIGYNPTPAGHYHALLEQVPHLSRTSIQSFLNGFAKQYPWDYGGEDLWPHFVFTGEVSNKLKAALNKGLMTGIDLVLDKPETNLGVGEEGLVAVEEVLRLRPPRSGPMRRRFREHDQLGVFGRMLKRARDGEYTVLRVRLNTAADRTLPSHVDIPTDDASVDAMFIRRTRKVFDARFANAHDKVVDEIASYGIEQVLGKK
jgi:hypothetical protein